MVSLTYRAFGVGSYWHMMTLDAAMCVTRLVGIR